LDLVLDDIIQQYESKKKEKMTLHACESKKVYMAFRIQGS